MTSPNPSGTRYLTRFGGESPVPTRPDPSHSCISPSVFIMETPSSSSSSVAAWPVNE
jgi:hypothetical protein